MNINWLMGFIEAKGSFTVSIRKIRIKRRQYTEDYIKTLNKKGLIKEVILLYKNDSFYIKKRPKSPLEMIKDIITIHSFSPEMLSELNSKRLKELLILHSKIKSLKTEDYRYYSRPTFSLTLNKDDEAILNEIKKYFEYQNIKTNGPYKMNEDSKLRLEIKGIENCFKLYDFLARQKWYTIKNKTFDEWGHNILKAYYSKFSK